jgi:hypothetical protein
MKYFVNTIIDGIVPDDDNFTCATNDDTNAAAAELLDDDTLSPDDDIGHLGPFEITKSPNWTKVLHPMTPTFRSSMVQEKAFISHKFDNIGWEFVEFGQIKGFQKLVLLRVIFRFIISLTNRFIIMPYFQRSMEKINRGLHWCSGAKLCCCPDAFFT